MEDDELICCDWSLHSIECHKGVLHLGRLGAKNKVLVCNTMCFYLFYYSVFYCQYIISVVGLLL